MNACCRVCEGPASDCCYVRMNGHESPACRNCWEQVLLDPRRILESLTARPRPGAAEPSGVRR